MDSLRVTTGLLPYVSNLEGLGKYVEDAVEERRGCALGSTMTAVGIADQTMDERELCRKMKLRHCGLYRLGEVGGMSKVSLRLQSDRSDGYADPDFTLNPGF